MPTFCPLSLSVGNAGRILADNRLCKEGDCAAADGVLEPVAVDAQRDRRIAVAELMRAIIQARCAGVAVIALVGGKSGAFGGAGLTAATCSRIVISEQGRIGVSGPEVIETNKGVEEFDAQDKALVWGTDGGKNRRLIGGADAFAEDSTDGFRAAAEAVLAKVPSFDLKTMQAEQERLTARQQRLGACDDAVSMWRILGIKDPEAVRDMDGKDLTALANGIKEANHDAR